jgi:hypothetical protein
VGALLHHENDLHMDLRTMTSRFKMPPDAVKRSKEDIDRYRSSRSGTVRGQVDAHKANEVEFCESASRTGISDEAVRTSAARFHAALT